MGGKPHFTARRLRLAPGTITDGLKRVEPLLQPIYAALREHNVQSAYCGLFMYCTTSP